MSAFYEDLKALCLNYPVVHNVLLTYNTNILNGELNLFMYINRICKTHNLSIPKSFEVTSPEQKQK